MMSRLCILCHSCMGWNIRNSWVNVVFCWGFDSEEMFTKSWANSECCPYIIWTTNLNFFFTKPLTWGRQVYKGKTCRLLRVNLQKHRKAVVRREIEKSGMADHIWKEKGNYLPLWYKVKIIDREGHWKRRRSCTCWVMLIFWVDQV